MNSLVGLNLRDNPLVFPPPEVTDQGVQTICRYLRRLLKAQREGRVAGRVVSGGKEGGGEIV